MFISQRTKIYKFYHLNKKDINMCITHFKKTLICVQASFTICTLFLAGDIEEIKPLNSEEKSNGRFHNELVEIIEIENI